MKDHGVLFQAEMMRALLREADPKTQTRRLKGLEEVNEDPAAWTLVNQGTCSGVSVFDFKTNTSMVTCRAPWAVGDTIYAKETFRLINDPATCIGDTALDIDYRADGKVRIMDKIGKGKWRPSIFMPRWASRYRAQITAVRCQRLQDITEEDAKAEGVRPNCKCCYGLVPCSTSEPMWVFAYSRLWIAINGPVSWDKNPWVFAYTFERIK